MTQHQIQHDPVIGAFMTTVDGVDARLEYYREGSKMVITHTGVPEAIGGRGIAGELVREAFEFAKAQGWHVHPQCSYAAAWVERHPEYNQLLA
ncbi:N-acetyltransferase [Lysobacter arenosi]|jgi:predicted GNAT family acetyltransferase|uniref:N-acetyltransferase n=1 Tax=Lysobacter arenosi TaxID=2795387 RepID=A0ABX7RFF4_9GAMM|nr:GNAT family N-acetyltransferase [Lysobacter arenosi]QSX76114.1 N-acetyltransferase [Lysobacter arenosi]